MQSVTGFYIFAWLDTVMFYHRLYSGNLFRFSFNIRGLNFILFFVLRYSNV